MYDLLKRMVGPGPVYATLGNHDSFPSDLASALSLGGDLGQQFSWYVGFSVTRVLYHINMHLGCMIMSLLFGITKAGYRKIQSSTQVPTMQHTW